MTIPQGDLKRVLDEGLASDLFRFDRARRLLSVIADRSSEIDTGPGNFGTFFVAIHAALTTEAVMAIARVFDVPDKKYPTRCIRAVLNYLRVQAENLPPISQPYQLRKQLEAINAPSELVQLAASDTKQFAINLSGHFQTVLDQLQWQENLRRLKDVRDKVLAHSEHGVSLKGLEWDSLDEFAQLGKDLIGVLGWAYFSTAWTLDGEFVLSNDAAMSSRALHRLLDKLYPKTTQGDAS